MADEPITEAKLGIYSFKWPSLNLMVRLSRLRASHDTISAEVVLRPIGAGDDIHIARFNLFSTQGKSTLARHLHECQNTLNWNNLIEGIAQYTIREYRKGEPVVEIGQLPLRKGARWRLQGIIPEGDIALLFGAGGSGKSWFALACGLAVSHGWDGLGLQVEKGPVLYLDWEWGYQEHNDRLKELEGGMMLDFRPSIQYRYCTAKLENDIETIQQIVLDKGIKLIIVDSLVPAVGGAKEAKENVEPLFTSLRSIPNTSALIISHQSKNPEDKVKSPYGDVFAVNRPRHVLEMRSVSETEGETEIAIYKYKSNLPPANLKGLYPLGFKLSTDELGTRFEYMDVNSIPELAERMSARQRIKELLKSGAMTTPEIATSLSLKEASVRQCLNRYRGKLFISLDPKLNTGRWGLIQIENN